MTGRNTCYDSKNQSKRNYIIILRAQLEEKV